MPITLPLKALEQHAFRHATGHRFIIWQEECDLIINQQKFHAQAYQFIFAVGQLALSFPNNTPFIAYQIDPIYIKERLVQEFYEVPIFNDFFKLSTATPHYLYFSFNDRDPAHTILELLNQTLATLPNTKVINSDTVPIIHHLFLAFIHAVHDKHHETLIISQSSMMDSNYLSGSILKYMAEHSDTITLKQIAAHYGYNATYFSRYFKQLMGISFSQKLKQIRFEQCVFLLSHTRLPIQEIAVEIGYHDINHFHQIFKEHFKLTPMQYRHQHQHNLSKIDFNSAPHNLN